MSMIELQSDAAAEAATQIVRRGLRAVANQSKPTDSEYSPCCEPTLPNTAPLSSPCFLDRRFSLGFNSSVAVGQLTAGSS